MKYINYKEERNHGTIDFPIEFYHVTPNHPRYDMSYHWHIEYELIRVLKWNLLMSIGENEFTAEAGDLIFIKGGLLHGGTPKDCVYECLVFNLESLMAVNHASERLLKKIGSDTLTIPALIKAPVKNLEHITSMMFEHIKKRTEGHELMVIGTLYQFLGYILENKLFENVRIISQKDSRKIEHLKKALEVIENHYADCITLEDLAQAAGMNSKYFCRYFKDMTHRTPVDYLNYYRIEQACFKLVTSNESIADIGLSCGFNDVSYFIKTFKKYKGMTPKKYLRAPL